jgi:hypothetical protein
VVRTIADGRSDESVRKHVAAALLDILDVYDDLEPWLLRRWIGFFMPERRPRRASDTPAIRVVPVGVVTPDHGQQSSRCCRPLARHTRHRIQKQSHGIAFDAMHVCTVTAQIVAVVQVD